MKKVLMILFIFLGIFIYQDTVEKDKSSQKLMITKVIIDNQISAQNSVAASIHSPFYFASYNFRIVVKILAIFFVIVGFVFWILLIKVAKDPVA